MASLGESRRRARLEADYSGVEELSDSTYNLVLGGVVVYGLLLNALACILLRPYMDALNANKLLIIGVYFVSCVIGVCMSAFSNNPFVSFMGYNLVVVPVGVVLSMAVAEMTELSPDIVYQAMFYTLIITVCMVVLGVLNPGAFLGLGGILFAGLTGLIMSGVFCWFMGWSTAWQAWIAVVLFSFYIGYDFQRSQVFAKTLDNAVDCALDIYLDIINLFLRIMQILAKSQSKGRRR